MPRGEWVAPVGSHHPDGRRGGRPVGRERMPGTCLPRAWPRLSDEACEDAVPGPGATRRLVGIDMTPGQVPDATTLPEFRHLPGGEGPRRRRHPRRVPLPGGEPGALARPGGPPGEEGRRPAPRARGARGRRRGDGPRAHGGGHRRERVGPGRGAVAAAPRRRVPPRRRGPRGRAGAPAGPRPPGPLGGHPGDREAPPGGPGARPPGGLVGARDRELPLPCALEGRAPPPRRQGPPRAREEPQPALRRLRARGPRPARAGGRDPGPDLRVGSPGPRRGREPNAGRRAARPEAPTRRPQVPRWMKSTHRPI